jgi:hypothetical protein
MSYPTDGIVIHEISTGDQSAGNGGSGHFDGDISNTPTINFNPTNFAIGATVTSTAGDSISQWASWDAGGAEAHGGLGLGGFGFGGENEGGNGAGGGTWSPGTGGAANGANGTGAAGTGGLAAASAASNGDQYSSSGHDVSAVTANTGATQSNYVAADMHQTVMAGIGGNGGSGNAAHGGDVRIDPTSLETMSLNNVLNNAEHFSVDDFAHVA